MYSARKLNFPNSRVWKFCSKIFFIFLELAWTAAPESIGQLSYTTSTHDVSFEGAREMRHQSTTMTETTDDAIMVMVYKRYLKRLLQSRDLALRTNDTRWQCDGGAWQWWYDHLAFIQIYKIQLIILYQDQKYINLLETLPWKMLHINM